jgi:hypothetical protein
MINIKLVYDDPRFTGYLMTLRGRIAQSVVTGQRSDDYGSVPSRDGIFLCINTSRQALGPTQPSIPRILEILSPGIKWLEHEADYSPSHRASGLRMCGTLPSVLPQCSDTGTTLSFILSYKLLR